MTLSPFEKVEALASNIRDLRELQRRQQATQAELIRLCVRAITQTIAEAQRSLEAERAREQKAGKRYRPVGIHEPGRKQIKDRKKALLYLEWLATRLEDASDPSKGPQPCTPASSSTSPSTTMPAPEQR